MKNYLVYLLVDAVFPTTIIFSQSEWVYKKTVSIDEEIESISIQGDTIIRTDSIIHFLFERTNITYNQVDENLF